MEQKKMHSYSQIFRLKFTIPSLTPGLSVCDENLFRFE